MASGYNYQPLQQQNEPINSYFQPNQRQTDPATPSPAYVTAPGSPGMLDMAAPAGSSGPQPSSSTVSAEPVQKIVAVSKEESNRSFIQEDQKKSASKEKLVPLKKHRHDFNSMDKKYLCCCGCMNVKAGALVIGVIQLVIVLLQFGIHFGLCFVYAKDYDRWPYEIYLNGAISATLVLSIFCLLMATIFEKGILFLPWQVVSLLEIFFFVFIGFSSIFLFFHSEGKGLFHVGLLIADILLLIGLIAILIWWNVVINKCKKYFADKHKYRRPMQLAEI